MSNISQTTTISLRDFRGQIQQIGEKLRAGQSVTVLRHSKPFFTVVPPVIDEWGDEVLPGDISIDFRKDGISADEFFAKLEQELSKKK